MLASCAKWADISSMSVFKQINLILKSLSGEAASGATVDGAKVHTGSSVGILEVGATNISQVSQVPMIVRNIA